MTLIDPPAFTLYNPFTGNVCGYWVFGLRLAMALYEWFDGDAMGLRIIPEPYALYRDRRGGLGQLLLPERCP